MDVIIPFEAGEDLLDKARTDKLQKYEPLKDWLELKDNIHSVLLCASVVGSLDPWEPANETALKIYGMFHSTANFSGSCVSQNLQCSLLTKHVCTGYGALYTHVEPNQSHLGFTS